MLRTFCIALGVTLALIVQPIWADVTLSDGTAVTTQLIVDPNTGRYYEAITKTLTWYKAKEAAELCSRNGIQGSLIESNSYSENCFAYASNKAINIWSGLTDDEAYGGTESSDRTEGWVWSDPNGAYTPLTTDFQWWQAGQPGTADYCIFNRVGQWSAKDGGAAFYSLAEFDGSEQEVAKAFYNRKMKGTLTVTADTIASGAAATNALNLINGVTKNVSLGDTGQTATIAFCDNTYTSSPKKSFLGTSEAINGMTLNANNFAVKSYVTVEIPEAGTYTIGGSHSDLLMLAFDQGSLAGTTVTMQGGYASYAEGKGTVSVTYDEPGTYNIYCLFAEGTDGVNYELAMAKGDYDVASATDATSYSTIYNNFVANAALIGDTANGGIATKNLRQIYTNGYTINNSATTSDTLNVSSSAASRGSFGSDQTIAAGTAINATTQLVVPENAGGWWTLGVSQSQEGSLTISQNGQAVAFSQASGATNGAAVTTSGAMTWSAPSSAVVDQAFGAVYLQPGTYDLSVAYNPNSLQSTISTPGLQVSGGFETYQATSLNGASIDDIYAAGMLMVDVYANGANSTLMGEYATGTYSTINFNEFAGDSDAGEFGNDTSFPLAQTVTDGVDFATFTTADIVVDAASVGDWTFCVNSDDGFYMQIYDENGVAQSFSNFVNTYAAESNDTEFLYTGDRSTSSSSLGTIALSEGTYSIELYHYNDGDGSLELSYAFGQQTLFNNDLFQLLGLDFESEQLELFAAAGVYSEFNLAFDLLGNPIDFEDQSEFTGEATAKIAGDANEDGKVDGSDVTILAGNWQKGVSDGLTASWSEGDFNGDGKVDGSDVTILAGNWQYGVEAETATVPEPSVFVLLLGSLVAFCFFRRRK